MPNLHEIAVNLTAKAQGFEQGINQGIAATKRLEDAVKRLQLTMARTPTHLPSLPGNSPGVKTPSSPPTGKPSPDMLALPAAFLKAQESAKRLEAELARLQRRQESVATATTSTASAMTKSSTAMNPFITQLKSAALAYVSLQAAGQGAVAIFQASAAVERQERAWRGIAGSVEGGRKELEFVRGSADRLGVTFTSLEEGYRKLNASSKGTTLEGQATRQIFLDIAQTMQVLGASSDDVAGAIKALSQMMSTGVVQADELRNQLGNYLPNVMGMAAQSMNMTTRAFSKLQETGGILTAGFLPNFARMMHQTYVPATDAGTKATLTLEQQLTRTGNILTEFAAKTFKDSGLEGWLTRLVGRVNDIGRETLEAGKRLDELAKRNTDKAISTQTKGVGLTTSKESLAAQAALEVLARRILEAEKLERIFSNPHTSWLNKQLNAEKESLNAQADFVILADLRRQYSSLLSEINKFRQGTGWGPEAEMATPDRLSPLTQQGIDRTEKIKAARLEMDALLKQVKDLGIAETATGKTRWEVEQEQLKLLNAELEKYTLKYKDLVAPSMSGAPSSSTLQRAPPDQLALIQKLSAQYKIDAALFESLIWKESQFNPKAVGPVTRSGEQAMGLGQLMPGTARALGVKDPYDIAQNLEGSAKYLAQMIAKFPGDLHLALAAYNAGPGRAQRALASFPETKDYVKVVTERAARLKGEAPGGATTSPIDTMLRPALDLQEQLKEQIGGREASVAIADKRLDAIDKETDAIARLAKQYDTLTTAEDQALRAETFARLEQQAAAGDTEGMAASLASLEEQLDKGSISLNKRERELGLVTLQSMGLYKETEALAAAALRSSYAFDDEATSLERGKKMLPEWTKYTKELIEANEKLAAVDYERFDAMNAIIEQMKEGLPTIEEYEKALRKLQGLGAGPGALAIAKNLEVQSTAAFKAIKQGAEDLAQFLQSHLLSQLTPFTGGEAEDFGSRISTADDRVSRLENRRDRLSEQLFERPDDKQLLEQLRRTDEALVNAKEHLKEFEDASIDAAAKAASPWRKFGDTVVQEFAKIVMEATKFREEMSKLLLEAGSMLLKLLGGISAGGDTTDLGGLGGASGGTGGLDFNAEGGFLGAGKRSMVGEEGRELMLSGGRMRLVGLHGPEVIRPRDNAFVIPHQQTMTLLRRRHQMDDVVTTMARRALGGPVNAGQDALVGEEGVEGVVSQSGGRRSSRGVEKIEVHVHGVKDLQSFVQPRSQAEIQRAMAAMLRAAEKSV